jgi:hypothetical protein
MHCKKIAALAGALLIAGLATASAAAKPTVTVRIEGKNKTLLPATAVTPPGAGRVSLAGRSCPAATGAGALALATHSRVSGKWSSLGLEVEKIFGESDDFTKTSSWWELFVNNVAATTGICDVKLHPGEQILFAAVPDKGTAYPLELRAPRQAKAGDPFTVTVRAFDAKGKAKALAGAKVDGQTTNAHGTARITLAHAGTVTLTATSKGHVRAEAQVHVLG